MARLASSLDHPSGAARYGATYGRARRPESLYKNVIRLAFKLLRPISNGGHNRPQSENLVKMLGSNCIQEGHPASEALRKRRRQSHERIFTTTSRDADMAGDEPAVQREWTRAGAGRLQDKGSKLADSRQVHTHR
jgi:hypothetical protein